MDLSAADTDSRAHGRADPHTPAEDAGLQRGDIITAFDGVAVTNMQELANRLKYYKGGETVEMTIQTAPNGAYEEKTVEVTLGLKSEYMQQ